MNISSIALGGLYAADSSFSKAASGLTQDYSGAGPDIVDLSSSAVALLNSKFDFAANLNTVAADDEMTKQTLNLLA